MTTAEERLNRRLDAEMESLEKQMSHIIKAASVRKERLEKPNDETQGPGGGGAGPKRMNSTSSNSADASIQLIKDENKIAQEFHLMEGSAQNMIRSAESLLGLCLEVKRALLLNDFSALNATVRSRHLSLASVLDYSDNVVNGQTAESEIPLRSASHEASSTAPITNTSSSATTTTSTSTTPSLKMPHQLLARDLIVITKMLESSLEGHAQP